MRVHINTWDVCRRKGNDFASVLQVNLLNFRRLVCCFCFYLWLWGKTHKTMRNWNEMSWLVCLLSTLIGKIRREREKEREQERKRARERERRVMIWGIGWKGSRGRQRKKERNFHFNSNFLHWFGSEDGIFRWIWTYPLTMEFYGSLHPDSSYRLIPKRSDSQKKNFISVFLSEQSSWWDFSWMGWIAKSISITQSNQIEWWFHRNPRFDRKIEARKISNQFH